jgi:D-alanyl-D-alanine carboxypeptidase/D-alanyl-D-alanine-endopeptidase (penicillin-binding protein 4)
MRRFLLALGSLASLLLAIGSPATAAPSSRAVRSLRAALKRDMGRIGGRSGALVVDLNTGQNLYANAANVARLPASVQKLYTTTSVLKRFGPDARLSTTVWGTGSLGTHGVWRGTIYLKGGGDPTFGTASFDHAAYGTSGTTVQRLVANLLDSTGITGIDGSIVGDSSYFDSLPSTAESNYRPDIYMEGELSGLAFDRGFANFSGTEYQQHPTLHAAQQFAGALHTAGVRLGSHIRIGTGRTPAQAQLLATVRSARMARLIALTNTPSDNFLAEMLLKGLGARFGFGGTTADGASVVRSELIRAFELRPKFNDGSGLSYADATSPRQVVTLLQAMAGDQVFRRSLAIGGQTGTLKDEMQGTPAAGHCQGKTGSLQSVANLSGYCLARDGHTLAFAFLASAVSNPDGVHIIEGDDMAPALAKYNG